MYKYGEISQKLNDLRHDVDVKLIEFLNEIERANPWIEEYKKTTGEYNGLLEVSLLLEQAAKKLKKLNKEVEQK